MAAIQTQNIFQELRANEFARLDAEQQIYLDYTGGNLYPQSLLDKHFEYLKTSVLGNPHSSNPTSKRSTLFVEEARKKVLNFFNAEDYYCIFTSNASSALQIVGECYPFNQDGYFLLTADNHNSVNGIREYCKSKGGNFSYITLKFEDLRLDENNLLQQLQNNPHQNKLFAFPAQSNVSGVKHNLKWISVAQQNGWDVLLDAAAFVPTSKLNLKEVQPDFVSVSFYKIFGYPTGLGCLLVKKSKFEKLQKPWFAGGTVSMVSVLYANHILLANHEKFENGTVNYLDIPAIKNGLDFIEKIGIENVSNRIKKLVEYTFEGLRNLKHDNGNPLVRIYGPDSANDKGGTFIFNVLDENGKLYLYDFIEAQASAKNISLRSGCFCNPGIDEAANCLTSDELSKYFTFGPMSYLEIRKNLGALRGAVRISVGIATMEKDLDKLFEFINGFKNKMVD